MKKFLSCMTLLCVFAATACFGADPLGGGNGGNGGNGGGGGGNEGTGGTESAVRVSSAEELADELARGPYRAEIEAEGSYGLSDPSSVGVDPGAMAAVKFPAPADSECTVYRAEEYGISSEAADNSGALNELLSSLREVQGKKKIVFGEGTYAFSAPLKIYYTSDLYLYGSPQGTEFVGTQWFTFFDIYDCTEVYLGDISLDYDPSPVVTGKIARADSAQVEISIDEGYDLSAPTYAGGQFVNGSYMEYIFDEYTGAYIPDADGNLLYNDGIGKKSYNAAAKTLTLSLPQMGRAPQVGTVVSVAFTMYNYPAVSAQNSTGLHFENVDIYTAPGMAFYFVSDRNVYLNRSDVRRKDGTRLMTATADGIHCKDTTGELKITGCLLEASHDDSINVCSFYKTVRNVSGNTVVLEGVPNYDFPLGKGNSIDVYRPNDYGFVGTWKVRSVDREGLVYTVTLDREAEGIAVGYLAGNATRVPRVTIENNIFRNKRNRGILVQFRNSVIRNNAFINIVHGAVILHSVADSFKEAIVPRDIELSGNKFISNNALGGLSGEISLLLFGQTYEVAPGTITGISIRNNYFSDSGYSGVFMQGAGSSEVKNNFFDNCALRANDHRLASVAITHSESVEVSSNYTLLPSPREGYQFLTELAAENITNGNNPIAYRGK